MDEHTQTASLGANRAGGTFYAEMEGLEWEALRSRVARATESDVRLALARAGQGTIDDLCALVSPAATGHLHEMASIAQILTAERFGKTISMYVPLYLSNECTNQCRYCGYSHLNKIPRKTLTDAEILREGEAIRKLGFEHILLLTGESRRAAGFEYLRHAIGLLRPLFAQISIEVQPMGVEEYATLHQEGLNGCYVYQETYNESTYPSYHLKGLKRNYRYRLETPDRLGTAGVHRIGLGALLGLEDWRAEAVCIGMHLRYLQRRYWRSKYSVAFPRLRPHAGSFEPNFPVGDRDLVQLIMAYRLFDRDVEMSLTTRESEYFRNNALRLGITSLSAGSHTEPGGYAEANKELEQFQISDARSPEEVRTYVESQGYEAVWKDWDRALQ